VYACGKMEEIHVGVKKLMKMYVLIRDILPVGKMAVAAAHAPLICYLKYKDHLQMKEWLDTSFKKVICRVTDMEWARAVTVDDHIVVTESTLNNAEVALVFLPRHDYPDYFKQFKLCQ